MQSLPVMIALGLAAYRATQLVVHDTIGDPVRQRIEMWHARKFDSRVRGFVRDLISCPYCAGWWLSMLTVGAYLTAASQWRAAPLWVHAIEAWAVTGLQALLNRLDDSLPTGQPVAR